jgi:hypothetical protein
VSAGCVEGWKVLTVRKLLHLLHHSPISYSPSQRRERQTAMKRPRHRQWDAGSQPNQTEIVARLVFLRPRHQERRERERPSVCGSTPSVQINAGAQTLLEHQRTLYISAQMIWNFKQNISINCQAHILYRFKTVDYG